jgi:hypothetical protein
MMKRKIFGFLILVLTFAALSSIARAQDPFIGTWKQRSMFSFSVVWRAYGVEVAPHLHGHELDRHAATSTATTPE